MNNKYIAMVVSGLVLVGCKSPVPSNHIKGSFGGVPFELQNPQQFAATNMTLAINVGSNSLNLHFDGLKSENDAVVIDKSFAGQIALEKARWDGLNATFSQAVAAGVNAAKK